VVGGHGGGEHADPNPARHRHADGDTHPDARAAINANPCADARAAIDPNPCADARAVIDPNLCTDAHTSTPVDTHTDPSLHRDAERQPEFGMTDGYGGLHPFGGYALDAQGAPYWPGWDIARSLQLMPVTLMTPAKVPSSVPSVLLSPAQLSRAQAVLDARYGQGLAGLGRLRGHLVTQSIVCAVKPRTRRVETEK